MTENEWEWKRGQNVWVLVGVSKDWAEAKGKEEEGEREQEAPRDDASQRRGL